MQKQDYECVSVVILDGEHGFDVSLEMGDKEDEELLKPACEWLFEQCRKD